MDGRAAPLPFRTIMMSSSETTALEVVGQGRFATVFVPATNGTIAAARAVKVYERPKTASPEDQLHNLHVANELRVAGKLQHECLIVPEQVHVGATKVLLTMEFAPNGTLQQYAQRFGAPKALPESEGRRLFTQILRALGYLHGQRIAHRDVNLENIVLDGRWNARLVDFGSVEEVVDGGLPCNNSRALGELSALHGTPGYMSPEALAAACIGHGAFDLLAADVWALGVSLYSLLHNAQLPFKGDHLQELLEVVRTRDPPKLTTHRMAEHLMRQMLSKAPHERPTVQAALRHEWIASMAADAWTVVSGAAALDARSPSPFHKRTEPPARTDYDPPPHSLAAIRAETTETRPKEP